MRQICFPHAGGSPTVFRTWRARLPGSIEMVAVRFPGRPWSRSKAPPSSLRQLTARMVDFLVPLRDRPPVLVGHSMGATVAFEAATVLEQRFGIDDPGFREVFLPVLRDDLRLLENHPGPQTSPVTSRSPRSRAWTTRSVAQTRQSAGDDSRAGGSPSAPSPVAPSISRIRGLRSLRRSLGSRRVPRPPGSRAPRPVVLMWLGEH
ncbi:alpha/beta fold hydrolase [Streptomyces sp. NPDC023838]|uniref:thioesterase II family protein n=1 Tax=Streptomyces sp. NPDC023838 TaxID=3154325 RepID=UPI0033CBB6F3